jgi:aerobic-type carbon monoxide dehydrogenase small subunit (CoxS/CutS family)
MQTVRLSINGRERRVTVTPTAFLVDVVRDDLALTGTKYACGMGECGACTVLIDGEAVYSCLTLASQVGDAEITTIEGLSTGGEIDPVAAAFAETGGVQCGFCTPGMVLSAKALLAENPDPTEDEIRIALSGNLCRCTGYTRIVNAVMAAARGEAQ